VSGTVSVIVAVVVNLLHLELPDDAAAALMWVAGQRTLERYPPWAQIVAAVLLMAAGFAALAASLTEV
jgi:hypothetical protein